MHGALLKSERGDLNPRPPEPHSGALPGCATLRYDYMPDFLILTLVENLLN